MNNSFFILSTLAVGMCLPVMAFSNGSLGKTLGSPYMATVSAFVVAALLVSIIIAVTRTQIPTISQFSNTRWTMWLGGAIIAMNILTFTIVPQKIEVGNTIIFFVAGQIVSSMIIENFGWLNNHAHPVNLIRITGVALLITGVILIKKF